MSLEPQLQPATFAPVMGAAQDLDSLGNYDPNLKAENFQIDMGETQHDYIFSIIDSIQDDHDLKLKFGFIENTDKDPYLLYSDTDSAYLLILMPFDKTEDINRTVKYCQELSFRLNTAYMKAMDLYFYKLGNWHPDFNTMDFKSEVIAFRGFFGAKKFYALGKIWEEGTFFKELKTKETGGQIKKADATQVTKELLGEIYYLLTKDMTKTDEVEIYRIIFIDLKNKYKMKLREAIQTLNFEYFTIPKKWSFGEKTNIPSSITGAKLYNRIIKDTFTIGDAVMELPIKFSLRKLQEEFQKINNPNENMMQNNELDNSIKKISLPPRMNEQEKEFLLQKFKELEITPNIDEIINFNIDMKLDPYKELFSVDIARKALH